MAYKLCLCSKDTLEDAIELCGNKLEPQNVLNIVYDSKEKEWHVIYFCEEDEE